MDLAGSALKKGFTMFLAFVTVVLVGVFSGCYFTGNSETGVCLKSKTWTLVATLISSILTFILLMQILYGNAIGSYGSF